MRYIALLRGINVGGKRKILMADLKALFCNLGCINVSTYIQSGNVIFEVPEVVLIPELEQKIKQAIFNKFEFEVPVIIRTCDDIVAITNNNPYINNSSEVTTNLHVTFLNKPPENGVDTSLANLNLNNDKFTVKEKDIYIYCNNKYHESKLTNNLFEKKLGVSATTRNWKTVLKLAELAKN